MKRRRTEQGATSGRRDRRFGQAVAAALAAGVAASLFGAHAAQPAVGGAAASPPRPMLPAPEEPPARPADPERAREILDTLLRGLSQRDGADGRPRARRPRRREPRRGARTVGGRRTEAQDGHDAPRGRAPARPGELRLRGRLAGDGDRPGRPRRSGGPGDDEPGPPPEPLRVQQRGQRAPRAGRRHPVPPARRRDGGRELRQLRRRPLDHDRAHGALHVRRAPADPAGRRTPPGSAGVETFEVPLHIVQDQLQSEELPFGSRGGAAVRHHFPVDGEYLIRIVLRRQYQDYLMGMGWEQQLDLRLDGALVERFTVGGGALDHRPRRPATPARASRAPSAPPSGRSTCS